MCVPWMHGSSCTDKPAFPKREFFHASPPLLTWFSGPETLFFCFWWSASPLRSRTNSHGHLSSELLNCSSLKSTNSFYLPLLWPVHCYWSSTWSALPLLSPIDCDLLGALSPRWLSPLYFCLAHADHRLGECLLSDWRTLYPERRNTSQSEGQLITLYCISYLVQACKTLNVKPSLMKKAEKGCRI